MYVQEVLTASTNVAPCVAYKCHTMCLRLVERHPNPSATDHVVQSAKNPNRVYYLADLELHHENPISHSMHKQKCAVSQAPLQDCEVALPFG